MCPFMIEKVPFGKGAVKSSPPSEEMTGNPLSCSLMAITESAPRVSSGVVEALHEDAWLEVSAPPGGSGRRRTKT